LKSSVLLRNGESTLNRIIYQFYVAYQSEQELKAVTENKNFDVSTFVPEILSDGQPNLKTIFVPAFSVEDAERKVNDYVSRTSYREIQDKTTI
jgi:hypothetical protein